MHFPESLSLNLERNCHTFSVFNTFLELRLLNYLQKMRGYPHFSFWIPITFAKIYRGVLFPHSHNLCKNTYHLLTESEVITGKSQTEALIY